jgi:ketosteroid isomerase-like protein
MSQENVDLVKRMLALFHTGDAEGALARFSADVVSEAPGRPDVAGGRGREALATLVQGWVEAWEDWNEVIEEVRDLGDRVMVISTQRGRERRTGIEVAMQYAALYGVRDGEICSMGLYGSPEEALETAGPRE